MGHVVLKPARLLFAVAAFAAAGCSAILGIDSDYTPDLDASVNDGDGGKFPDGSMRPDATMTGDDAGPGSDAQGSSDATMAADVLDGAPVLCSDGAASPRVAALGSACCLNNVFACDQGQQLEVMICDNNVWTPATQCGSSSLCRFDVGELPDGGAENDGGIVGNGSGSGQPGTCVLEIAACTGKQPGTILCTSSGASNNVLVVCGADLTTAYEEACHKSTSFTSGTFSPGSTLCNVAVDAGQPHCPQCVDQVDFACNGSAPAFCSDGGWVQEPSCEAGTFCHGNDGTCQTDVCTPGTFTCVGDTLIACDALGDSYQDGGTACAADTCDSTKGTCDVCPPSQAYGCNANGSSYTTCKPDGSGKVITSCPASAPICTEAMGTTNASCVQCVSPTDCTPNACQTAACGNGMCSYAAANEGNVLAYPTAGTCTGEISCVKGAPTTANAPDGYVTTPPDNVDCAETVCTGGAPGPANPQVGTPCMVGGANGPAGTCDATGTCTPS